MHKMNEFSNTVSSVMCCTELSILYCVVVKKTKYSNFSDNIKTKSHDKIKHFHDHKIYKQT